MVPIHFDEECMQKVTSLQMPIKLIPPLVRFGKFGQKEFWEGARGIRNEVVHVNIGTSGWG